MGQKWASGARPAGWGLGAGMGAERGAGMGAAAFGAAGQKSASVMERMVFIGWVVVGSNYRCGSSLRPSLA